MDNFFKAAAVAFLSVLSGCALNQPVSTTESYQADVPVKPTSSIALYVYPQAASVSNDVESGYFVEFDLADKSDVPTVKFQD